MTVAVISSMSPVRITVSGGSSVVLPTERYGLSLGIMQTLHRHSGNVPPTACVVPGGTQKITISVPLFAAIETFGLGLVKLTQFDGFLSRFADYNKVEGAYHFKIGLESACAAAAEITTWNVNVDGIAMATVEIVPLSDNGANSPVKFSESQELPLLASQPLLHTLGPIKINGTVIPGLSSQSGSINGSPIIQRTDGDKFPRVCARLQTEPTLDLNHADPKTLLAALGVLGSDITADVSAFLKAYDASTGVVSQSNGIEFLVEKGRIHPAGADSSQGQVSTTAFRVHAISSDGYADALQVNTGVEVPVMT